MKKLALYILIVSLLSGLAACDGRGAVLVEEPTDPPETTTPAATARVTPSPRPSPSPSPLPTAPPGAVLSGTVGKNIFWEVDPETRTLTLSGAGAIPDYMAYDVGGWKDWPPWVEFNSFPWGYSVNLIDRLVIGEGITKIGAGAFEFMYLAEVILPDSLKIIGEAAFRTCTAPGFAIPRNVAVIEEKAFAECSISAFSVAPENKAFCAVDGVLFDKKMARLISYPSGKETVKYEVPKTVKSIESYAFSAGLNEDSLLEEIILPEGLISIGNAAFSCRGNLTKMNLPKSLRAIGCAAFWGTGIQEFVIPEGIKEIAPNTFDYVSPGNDLSLRRIALPSSLKKIDKLAFVFCSELSEVYFLGKPPTLVYDDYEEAYPFDFAGDKFILYYPRKLASYWAPKGETTWHGFPIEPYDELPDWAR
ncbi:MAG: leucine-rich repeat domain-containing protein [Clostridiales bacterium]|nr:leucine-rich repeat domain-containing protein [Clostridiales bacterium]